MPLIKREFGLSVDQVANINIAAVTVTILVRCASARSAPASPSVETERLPEPPRGRAALASSPKCADVLFRSIAMEIPGLQCAIWSLTAD
jgi:hypothetical protein